MQLQIVESNGIHEINGDITKENIEVVKTYLETVLDANDIHIIDLNKVNKIDIYGINLLISFYRNIELQNKRVLLLGYNNRGIKSMLLQTKMSFILSDVFQK
ncbi:STAS domain-containing protein [Tenacibaculum sp. SG-28]|uniref:STAS domain-containing protein n=1 Tax=Tenacibaculum sp. SG-28 TaxID=754426 RepID=UPI000CF54951|nr:STAS domain-containing protein [Tenacibaculum sp. SG-28]PQJ23077.1 hypothetical protein BSU00_02115 [Tenacibaculum sp. SG-28]